jgi:hypothetical protein
MTNDCGCPAYPAPPAPLQKCPYCGVGVFVVKGKTVLSVAEDLAAKDAAYARLSEDFERELCGRRKAEAERDAYIKTAEMTYRVQTDLRAEVARLRAALTRIEKADYRGEYPRDIAREALEKP